MENVGVDAISGIRSNETWFGDLGHDGGPCGALRKRWEAHHRKMLARMWRRGGAAHVGGDDSTITYAATGEDMCLN